MPKQKAVAKPSTEPDRSQVSVINLKGTGPYRDWLSSVSKKTHIPAASIVRLALADWASKNAHQPPPER
jgi:hypothetical protein